MEMQYGANRKVTTGVFSVMFCKVQKYLGAGKCTPFPFSKAEKAKKHLFRCKKYLLFCGLHYVYLSNPNVIDIVYQ